MGNGGRGLDPSFGCSPGIDPITEFNKGARLYKSPCFERLFVSAFGWMANIALPSWNKKRFP